MPVPVPVPVPPGPLAGGSPHANVLVVPPPGFTLCKTCGEAETVGSTFCQSYASRAVQFHPGGSQFDFVCPPARTPHVGPQYVW